MSSVDQAVIDLVEDVSIWKVPALEVDSFVHELSTVDQSETIFFCTLRLCLPIVG
jgi:hypothetical protein